jgi:quinol-cytochrome oxidoreductase complex cytochrome b subunit
MNFKKKYKNFILKVKTKGDHLSFLSWLHNSFRWQTTFPFNLLSAHLVLYGTPANLNYSWSFGSLAGVSLVIQILSGLFLTMFYTPHIDFAFSSVEFIMRDVKHGWC